MSFLKQASLTCLCVTLNCKQWQAVCALPREKKFHSIKSFGELSAREAGGLTEKAVGMRIFSRERPEGNLSVNVYRSVFEPWIAVRPDSEIRCRRGARLQYLTQVAELCQADCVV